MNVFLIEKYSESHICKIICLVETLFSNLKRKTIQQKGIREKEKENKKELNLNVKTKLIYLVTTHLSLELKMNLFLALRSHLFVCTINVLGTKCFCFQPQPL